MEREKEVCGEEEGCVRGWSSAAISYIRSPWEFGYAWAGGLAGLFLVHGRGLLATTHVAEAVKSQAGERLAGVG